MLDERILDKILPLPTMDAVSDAVFADLAEKGFVITNTRTGGIFSTLVKISIKCHIELIKFARSLIGNIFIESAEGPWLELLAGDFCKDRKLESKTEGKVTLTRATAGDAVTVTKGTVFKTAKDENGNELKFIVTEAAVMIASATTLQVPVIAENPGVRYNVAPGRITRCLINLEGIDAITNATGWITTEGADTEDIESLRSRTRLSWSELAMLPTREKYKNTCESVTGVLMAEIDDNHPRGQGTVDVYITGTAGTATGTLLELVKTAVETIRGPYDNVLVKSTATVPQNVTVAVTLATGENLAGVKEAAIAVIDDLLAIKAGKELNRLTHTDIIHGIKSKIPAVRAVTVTVPTADVKLSLGSVLVAGTVTVTASKEA